LQAIARVNRPYEDEDAELVKPHGFVLDFVGIFDKLEKALAFDSEEINAIIKTLTSQAVVRLAYEGTRSGRMCAWWERKFR